MKQTSFHHLLHPHLAAAFGQGGKTFSDPLTVQMMEVKAADRVQRSSVKRFWLVVRRVPVLKIEVDIQWHRLRAPRLISAARRKGHVVSEAWRFHGYPQKREEEPGVKMKGQVYNHFLSRCGLSCGTVYTAYFFDDRRMITTITSNPSEWGRLSQIYITRPRKMRIVNTDIENKLTRWRGGSINTLFFPSFLSLSHTTTKCRSYLITKMSNFSGSRKSLKLFWNSTDFIVRIERENEGHSLGLSWEKDCYTFWWESGTRFFGLWRWENVIWRVDNTYVWEEPCQPYATLYTLPADWKSMTRR